MSAPWPAPRARAALRATVDLPGSKSHTNRAFVLAALSDGPSVVRRPLMARDTELMVAALRAMGVRITGDGAAWIVVPGPLHGASVDTGLAGTVMRFVPPVAALALGDVHFDGDEYARERPMATLLDALRQVGVDIDDGGRGALPFTVHGTGSVIGGRVDIDASGSSQFVSALLLAGARWDKGVEIRHVGAQSVPSMTHIAMTVAGLRERGVEVDESVPGVWRVGPGRIVARDADIEPDLSNAAPFLAAALVTSGTVTIAGWPERTTQAGDALRPLLTSMGASVSMGSDGVTVSGGDGVHGLTADLHDVGELTPVLAALCALADGPSRLTGIAHLRGHETDRLAALATELTALGGSVTELDDGLVIEPATLHGGLWHSYADHRIAQAGAVIGLAVDGVTVENIETTRKTLPDFPGMWTSMLDG